MVGARRRPISGPFVLLDVGGKVGTCAKTIYFWAQMGDGLEFTPRHK
jgi:fatty acid/phospholipid biosynthesis enzyme